MADRLMQTRETPRATPIACRPAGECSAPLYQTHGPRQRSLRKTAGPSACGLDLLCVADWLSFGASGRGGRPFVCGAHGHSRCRRGGCNPHVASPVDFACAIRRKQFVSVLAAWHWRMQTVLQSPRHAGFGQPIGMHACRKWHSVFAAAHCACPAPDAEVPREFLLSYEASQTKPSLQAGRPMLDAGPKADMRCVHIVSRCLQHMSSRCLPVCCACTLWFPRGVSQPSWPLRGAPADHGAPRGCGAQVVREGQRMRKQHACRNLP